MMYQNIVKISLILFLTAGIHGQTIEKYTISKFAGIGSGVRGYSGDGGPAISSQLNKPSDVVEDAKGNIYIVDNENHVIRQIDTNGRIQTIAGTGEKGFSGDDGPAIRAQFLFPRAMALDQEGNILVSDTMNHRIRRINKSGIITTIAGTGKMGFNGDRELARQCDLNWPMGIAVGKAGIIYFADSKNCLIRKIDLDGRISIVAGTPGKHGYQGDGGPATLALLWDPWGIALDAANNIYFTERWGHRIRRVSKDGIIETIAGNGSMGSGESTEGQLAKTVSIPYPAAISVSPEGNVVFESEDRIWKIEPDGTLHIFVGPTVRGWNPESNKRSEINLGSPFGITYDHNGRLLIADTYRDRILRVEDEGVNAIAGMTSVPEEQEGGPAEFAHLSNPWAVSVAPTEDIYVADTGRDRICRITVDGKIFKAAGKGRLPDVVFIDPPPKIVRFSGDGGPASDAELDQPNGVAVDKNGNIYISDSSNNRIREVDSKGIIQTIAGTGISGYGGDEGPATNAELAHPMGIALDSRGNLYIADRENNRIRMIDTMGIIRTVAGNGKRTDGGAGDRATDTGLSFPHGVAVDSKDQVYIADTFNHRIKRIGLDGRIEFVAGTGKQEYTGDEIPAVKSGLGCPDSVAIDREGNLYVADRANWRVRKIDQNGIIHTIAGGINSTNFRPDGVLGTRSHVFPVGIAVDTAGNVYIADQSTIRRLTPNVAQ